MNILVNIEDLETLVWATSVLKTVEGALATRKIDPFVRPHLDFTAANDRCAAIVRDARRQMSGTLVVWDEVLSEGDEKRLRRVDENGILELSNIDQKVEYDTLAAKGYVVIGTGVSGTVWSGEKHADINPTHRYRVKVTDRGRAKIAKIDAEKIA